jgi:Ca2+-binding RTX toxin-like protein
MGSAGRDRYDGGTGVDTASYANARSGVVASLFLGRGSVGDAARDLYVAIENLTGSNFADNLSGDNGRNELAGLGGDDFIFGNGNGDRITGGGGNDAIDGGAGYDYAVYSGLRSHYGVSTVSGVTTVSHTGGTRLDGIDRLTTVEVLVFSDGNLFI